jgi:hypothetical protein
VVKRTALLLAESSEGNSFSFFCCIVLKDVKLAQQAVMHALTLSNPIFSANRILPSSYLFWAVKRLVEYL